MDRNCGRCHAVGLVIAGRAAPTHSIPVIQVHPGVAVHLAPKPGEDGPSAPAAIHHASTG